MGNVEQLVFHFSKSSMTYESMTVSTGKAGLSSVIQYPFSNTMGAGFINLEQTAFDWQVKYDEVIYVVSGSMYIIENEKKINAKEGDIYFLKKGAKVTYGTDKEVVLFYALYPSNWRELYGIK